MKNHTTAHIADNLLIKYVYIILLFHRKNAVGGEICNSADPFVCYADLSPNRGITLIDLNTEANATAEETTAVAEATTTEATSAEVTESIVEELKSLTNLSDEEIA